MYGDLAAVVHKHRLADAERSRLRVAARKLRRTSATPPRPSRRTQHIATCITTGLP